MQVKINKKMVQLDKTEVQSVRKSISNIIKHALEASQKSNRPTYYFTFLIMMHTMSNELLNTMDAEHLSTVMNALQEIREKKEKYGLDKREAK